MAFKKASEPFKYPSIQKRLTDLIGTEGYNRIKEEFENILINESLELACEFIRQNLNISEHNEKLVINHIMSYKNSC